VALTNKWTKSSRSNNNGACVEVRQLGDLIEVRSSNIPDSPVVPFTGAEWDAFISGAQDGEFNRG